MLELATLGLLQKEPLHGYKLKQQLEQFISGCISVNYGAIYPLLKRLEKQNLLTLSMSEGEAGGKRKIYAITEKGKARFQEKMLEHPKESWVNARSRFMVKFVFFSHLHRQQRIELIEQRLTVCRTRLEEQQCQSIPDDHYIANACNRYLQVIQDEMDWLQVQLNKET
ncbi:transcriptional regulator, PadR-like family [Halothece sp. PCC 7418]|uniref:PadR family transcriptional regulator n=1 Tax=Halothece sp. (strain PCC 7418) TaxID=65093 RepID=UPI0002A063A9|nr:PadR family transcriptional regulator [Halothece sp. PCC 7418]AFZ45222.1 transcriptional regulator, PadR-like family [Halothece sp. PCC 7418]